MKFISKKPGYAQNVLTVELTEEEKALSDNDLITLADNHGVPNRQACHFGGKVERKENNQAVITVYID